MTSKPSQVPVYVPTEGEVVQQAYVVTPTVVPEASSMTITDDMIKTYSLARTVKLLTLIDMFFSFMYCFYNPWFFIPLLIAISGYRGAVTFNANYIFLYATYVILEVLIKSAIFFAAYASLSNDERANHLFNVILVILSIFISIWILDVLYKFIKFINKLTHLELEHLCNRGIPRHRLVYVWY
tara:strand:+ start:616 stop:1164 length:549 start_codon:yes stop_codon:yes gene_type:complete